MPASGFGEVVAVSGTHVAPDTTITGGPRDGAEVREEQTFEFTGSDDVADPSELTFECKVDTDDWSACESPEGGVLDNGRHTLLVRAVDEMLNVDPTPAKRRWRLDTKAPSRPSVAGPRSRKRAPRSIGSRQRMPALLAAESASGARSIQAAARAAAPHTADTSDRGGTSSGCGRSTPPETRVARRPPGSSCGLPPRRSRPDPAAGDNEVVSTTSRRPRSRFASRRPRRTSSTNARGSSSSGTTRSISCRT